jgi:hypothetical protein
MKARLLALILPAASSTWGLGSAVWNASKSGVSHARERERERERERRVASVFVLVLSMYFNPAAAKKNRDYRNI